MDWSADNRLVAQTACFYRESGGTDYRQEPWPRGRPNLRLETRSALLNPRVAVAARIPTGKAIHTPRNSGRKMHELRYVHFPRHPTQTQHAEQNPSNTCSTCPPAVFWDRHHCCTAPVPDLRNRQNLEAHSEILCCGSP